MCIRDRIANCCQPNALMTLKEYLEDYASSETKEKGMRLIREEMCIRDRVIPDRELSIAGGAIAPLGKAKNSMIFWQITALLEKYEACLLYTSSLDGRFAFRW